MASLGSRTSLLLLTATVAPTDAVPNVSVRDPETRLRDYVRAARWWARVADSMGLRVLVVENSGWAARLSRLVPTGVGVLDATEAPGESPTSRGKGALEAIMIRRALESESEIERIIKATGRLRVLNARRLVASIDSRTRLTVDLNLSLSMADTRFLAFDRGLARELLAGIESDVDEAAGQYLEHAICRRVLAMRLRIRELRMSPWPETPVYAGTSGTSGRKLDTLPRLAKAGSERVIGYRLKSSAG